MRHKSLVRRSCLLLAVLLLLSSCGIFEAPPPEAGPDFRFGYTGPWPETRNPLLDAEDAGALLYTSLLYEPLVDAGPDCTWRGRLAEDWSLAADELTWTFYLRKGVKWHDGTDFTADDVIFTYDAAKTLGLPVAARVADIVEVSKADDYTVTLKTLVPTGELLDAFLPILPRHIFGAAATRAALEELNPDPVGTGPFRFVAEAPGEWVRYAAYEDYWAGRPGTDGLVMTACTPEEAASALGAGQLDYCLLDTGAAGRLGRGDGLTRRVFATDSLVILGFNCWDSPDSAGNPILLDRRVRIALDQCMDYDRIARAAPAPVYAQHSVIPGTGGYAVDFARDAGYRPRDRAAAAAALEKAGYIDRDGDGVREDKKENPMSFTLALPPELAWAGELLAGEAAQIGIRLIPVEGRAEPMELGEAFGADLFLYRQTGGLPDPGGVLDSYTTGAVGYGSYTCYANPEYDDVAARGREAVWPEDRLTLIRQAQQVLYRDAPCAVLYRESALEIYNGEAWEGWQARWGEGGSLWCWETLCRLTPVPEEEPTTAAPPEETMENISNPST